MNFYVRRYVTPPEMCVSLPLIFFPVIYSYMKIIIGKFFGI